MLHALGVLRIIIVKSSLAKESGIVVSTNCMGKTDG